MNNNLCIKFIDHISNNIKDINNPLTEHNTIFNSHWNNNKQNINHLIEILYNQLKTIIKPKIKIQHNKHDKWDTIIHEYPISYINYQNIVKIDYSTFNEKINRREINLYNIDYKLLIQKYINPTIDNTILNILDRFHNGKFISLDIRLYTENYINNCYTYLFSHLELYLFNNDKEFNNLIRDDLVLNIYQITKWIYNLNPIKKIILYYFDTTINKQIIRGINYFCSQNINSGLSTTDYIIIWRREEIFKVLIHELIHYLDIDFKHNTLLNTIINYTIGIFDYPILINETITEIQAQFYNTLYTLIIDNIDSTVSEINKLFKIFYNLEQIYSWYQFTKIMNYLSIDSFDIELIKKNFNQSTNVYSYYILKSIFTMHFFDILNELNYIQKLIKLKSSNNILIKIKNIIDNLPIIFINKIIKNLQINNDSLRLTIFGYY